METPMGPMELRRSLRATPARPRPGGDAADNRTNRSAHPGPSKNRTGFPHSSAVAEQKSEKSEFFFLPLPFAQNGDAPGGAGRFCREAGFGMIRSV